jgi:hypothetical protein
MDFIMGLLEESATNAIIVVVKRFYKMANFIPTAEEISALKTTELLAHYVWKLYSTTSDIISDYGPQFISSVWKTMCHCHGIKRKLSTALHPQTDGITKCINA